MKAVLHFDGACRGNPGGRSAGAAVLSFEKAITVHKPMRSDVIGMAKERISIHGPVFHGTNNEAEWQGLLAGLHEALKRGVRNLTIFGDSKLVVMQVKGEWRVKKEHLKPLHAEAKALLENFESWSIAWVPREQNQDADRASNEAIDRPRRPLT